MDHLIREYGLVFCFGYICGMVMSDITYWSSDFLRRKKR